MLIRKSEKLDPASLSRRRFIKTTGGLALALPIMESLLGFEEAQAASNADRLVVVLHHQGTLPSLWTPPAEGELILSPLLQPLSAFQEKLLVIGGIDNRLHNVVIEDHLHKNVDNHHGNAKSLLTCMPLSQIIDSNGNLRPTPHPRGEHFHHAGGPSFEQVIANQIGSSSLHKAIYLWVDRINPGLKCFYAGKDDPVSGISNPLDAISLLFSDITPGGGSSTAIQRLQMQRRSILDTMVDELARVKMQLSSEDRQRLEAHEQKVRDLEIRLGNTINPGAGCQVPVFNPPPGYEYGTDEWADVTFDIMSDIIALAFECDITRVATISFANGNSPTFPFLQNVNIPGSFTNWHSMVHDIPLPTTNNPNELSANQSTLYQGFNWYSEKVAELLQKLDGFPNDNGGTLLDSSLVVWTSDYGRGDTHDTRDLPFVLAGGLNGKVSTNRFIRYPDRTSCNDLFTTFMNLYGLDVNNFGWPDFSNGPLSGIAV